MGRGGWGRRLVAAGTVALLTLGLSIAGTSAASASTGLNSTPSAGWGVDGKVFTTLVVGNTAFVGGAFKNAIAPDGTLVPRSRLAAFDMSTGALLTSWRADAGSTVRSLASDGTWLYVGGSFGRIGGAAHVRLARVSVATDAVDPGFTPSLDQTVRALQLDGGALFAGGAFTTVDGVAQTGLAKLDADTGALDRSFSARADNAVYGLALGSSRNTLYLAGQFGHLGGSARAGVGAVDASTGAVSSVRFSTTVQPTLALSLSADGSILYGGGGGKGSAGANTAAAWSTTSGSRLWHVTTEGDIQAIDYFGGEVYFGFHEGYAGDSTARLLAADAGTGALDPDFRPRFDRFWGVYAIDATSAGLSVGGDFGNVSGVSVDDWVRFLPAGAATNQPPTASFTSSVQGLTADVDASGSTDPDGTVRSYAWQFGDGGTATGRTATHTYAAAGTYTVTLTVTDDAGATASTTRQVQAQSTSTAPPSSSVIIPQAADWSWRYSAGPPPAQWNARGFDPSTWADGPAPLGFGDTSVATDIDTYADPLDRPRAAYFVHPFQVSDASAVTGLQLDTLADDGVVVYVNGTEVARANMPAGTITDATFASSAVRTANAPRVTIDVPTGLLVDGTNVIAAETHLNYRRTHDLTFHLEATLTASH